MIVDKQGSHYIFVFSKKYVHAGLNYIKYKNKPLTNKEYLQHWGKWLVLGRREELEELANRLDPYVEREQIPCIKFDRAVQKEFEEMLLRECVMCIYCDERQREDVWKILAQEGVTSKAWQYEKNTMEAWLPGGRLLERWIKARRLTNSDAEKVREDALLYFAQFEDEDAVFTGVIQ
ncbi:MAG: hypothetical protein APF81_25860 [Desulfosporosinus sp. BRH_c37]|nr:MAG: hypothetical protein APF81_25860 [Desulfosporosinus sp. BRH_c37]